MILSFEQYLDVPRDTLFAFHTHPENLAVLLEGWAGFDLLTHDRDLRAGARFDVRQRLGPLRFRMTFEVTRFEPPFGFAERMVAGPFRSFDHAHEFHESGSGTTLVDRLDFGLPWRLGGRIAERSIAVPTLRRFFAFRRSAYLKLIADGRFPARIDER